MASIRELQPGRKVVFTWQWQDDQDWENHISLVTLELSDRDGGTELLLRHEQLPGVESRDGHKEGWNSALEKLEHYFLERRASARPSKGITAEGQ